MSGVSAAVPFASSFEASSSGCTDADGIDQDTQLESWSMGKSVTATMVGLLMQQGAISADLDAPPPIAAWKDDERSAIRMRDILQVSHMPTHVADITVKGEADAIHVQMSSGLRFSGFDSPREEWDHGRPDHALMYSEAIDCFEWAISRPLEHPPGTVGRYRNCDPLSLGFIVRQTVEANGGDYLTFPQRELFDPLGIRKQILETDLWASSTPIIVRMVLLKI